MIMTTLPFLSENPENEDIDALELFRYAIEQGCSDIHAKPGSPIKLRINGNLLPIEGMKPLTPSQTLWLVDQTQSDAIQAQFAHDKHSINYAYDLPGIGRFRINTFRTRNSLGFVARHLIDTPPTFEELDTNPVIADLANLRSGLILFSGATGSGKTTLMAAMIQRINSTRSCNIISAEDPIEIVHRDIKASVIQREVGIDVESFGDALTDALREDPDVILIGEIREEAEARAALKAAETGHLVISTIHGINAEKSITRFLEMFDYKERESTRTVLSGALRAIIGQRLVRNLDGGRTAVNEILLNTLPMQLALEDKNVNTSELATILENSSEDGMQTFESDLARLFEEGVISETSALEESTYKDKVIPLLEEAKQRKRNKAKKPTQPEEFHGFSEQVNQDVEKMRRATAAPTDLQEFLQKPPARPGRFVLPPRA